MRYRTAQQVSNFYGILVQRKPAVKPSNIGFNKEENIETDIPKTFAEETNINSNEDKDEKVFDDGDENPNNNANSKDNANSFKKVVEEVTEDDKDELNHSAEVDDSG